MTMNIRGSRILTPLVVAGLIAGCETTSGPERRDLSGSWIGEEVSGVVIRMTLAETSRSVDGAGSWAGIEATAAFRVTGAMAMDEVSLYLDFDAREAMNFQGVFEDEDTIVGTLYGAPVDQAQLTLSRDDLLP
ncbi:MAG: hypothetical protein WD737_10985 [Gemmatimonadota bacterium]